MEISKEVYEVINTVARRKGKTIEELLVELVLPDLDLEARVEVYPKLHRKYLNEAEKLYKMGDLVQASKKYWSAVTTLLKAVAEIRSRTHSSHRDLRELANQLYRETSGLLDAAAEKLAEKVDRRVYDDWSHAYFLHVKGFHEARLTIDRVKARARYIGELLEIARSTVAKAGKTTQNTTGRPTLKELI